MEIKENFDKLKNKLLIYSTVATLGLIPVAICASEKDTNDFVYTTYEDSVKASGKVDLYNLKNYYFLELVNSETESDFYIVKALKTTDSSIYSLVNVQDHKEFCKIKIDEPSQKAWKNPLVDAKKKSISKEVYDFNITGVQDYLVTVPDYQLEYTVDDLDKVLDNYKQSVIDDRIKSGNVFYLELNK